MAWCKWRGPIRVIVANLIFALISGLATVNGVAWAAETTVVQTSRPYVARAGAWQSWTDHLHILPGMEKRTLQLTLINGAEGRAQMTDIEMQLARKPFITIKDFNNQPQVTRSLSGIVGPGDTVVSVRGFGPSGARLVWQLASDKVSVSSVSPNPFGATEKITVSGTNFSDNPAHIKVDVGGKHATVVSSTGNQIVLKLPAHLPGGIKNLVVTACGTKSEAFKVTCLAQPHISWVDLIAAPPGHPVVITGTGFAPNPAGNLVKFDKLPAHIVSASEKSITCIIPDMDFPIWHVPITVTTHGMTSKEQKKINVDHRIIENNGIHQY